MTTYGKGQIGIPDRSIPEINELIEDGYCILRDFMDHSTLAVLLEKVYRYYAMQEAEFGVDKMNKMGELNVLRCPIYHNEAFFSALEEDRIVEIARAFLGEHYILHLQNAIINRPSEKHQQSAWHRDLPYQNHIISKPLALNVFLCLTDFSSDNGATCFIPKGHRIEEFPSDEELEKKSVQLKAKAGDVILFDSMILHRAGINRSNADRIGLNHVLVKPLLKQQIDLPALFDGKHQENPIRSALIGYRFAVPKSVKEFREIRLKRLEHG